jgi:hypothetical protein
LILFFSSFFRNLLARNRFPNISALEYHRLNRSRGRLSGQTRIRVRFEKAVTRWIEWLIVSREEMKQLINRTGWKISRFTDSEDAGYIAIIEKSAQEESSRLGFVGAGSGT